MAGAGSDRPAVPSGFDVVRRWFDAFNRRDLDALLALAHPEISFSPLQVHGADVLHGHDGVAAVWARMEEVGLDHRIAITALHTLEDGRTAAIGLVQPGDVDFVGIYRIEDGLVREGQNRFAGDDTLRRLGIADAGD
jgi:ketosteroid isomerase-like protein